MDPASVNLFAQVSNDKEDLDDFFGPLKIDKA